VSLSFIVTLAGYGCVGVGFGRVLCKWKGEKVSGKNIFKNLLLPCLCMRREEEAARCRSKRHRAGFFFLKKRKEEKKNGIDPKIDYDINGEF